MFDYKAINISVPLRVGYIAAYSERVSRRGECSKHVSNSLFPWQFKNVNYDTMIHQSYHSQYAQ